MVLWLWENRLAHLVLVVGVGLLKSFTVNPSLLLFGALLEDILALEVDVLISTNYSIIGIILERKSSLLLYDIDITNNCPDFNIIFWCIDIDISHVQILHLGILWAFFVYINIFQGAVGPFRDGIHENCCGRALSRGDHVVNLALLLLLLNFCEV